MYLDPTPERIANEMRDIAAAAADAAALRERVEALLAPALQAWGAHTKHRDRWADGPLAQLRGRADAMYEAVFIAYEAPGELAHPAGVARARRRLEGALQAAPRPAVGIGLDGQRLFFLRPGAGAAEVLEDSVLAAGALGPDPPAAPRSRNLDLQLQGPYLVSPESCLALLIYLRALDRRPLTAAHIADTLGPQAPTARRLVGALYDGLARRDSPAVRSQFARWDALCGQLYGDAVQRASGAVATLARGFGLTTDPAAKPLLCAIHTYYALVVKLLMVELVTLRRGAVILDPLAPLAELDSRDLQAWLAELESGHFFARWGVLNVLDDDLLSWYLLGWDDAIEAGIRALARAQAGFEPATGSLEPTAPLDPLRALYQLLVPWAVRHVLDERFTPSWLAELLLVEAGYDGDLDQRLLDPVCGFGAVLTQAIKRARRWADEQLLEPAQIVDRLLANVGGFELNPLAAITARANYLFALEALVGYAHPLEIPIYCQDSLLGPSIHPKPFQFVVGNPPWPAWETLSPAYRAATRPLLERYRLGTPPRDPRARGGRAHAMSLLFTQVCADRYLADGGTLAFVVTRAALRADTAQGGRRLPLGRRPALRVERLSELRALSAHGDAQDPPCTLVLSKGQSTTYPVPYVVWNRLVGRPFKGDTPLATVRALTTRQCLVVEPVRLDDPATPWLIARADVLHALRAARGQAAYTAQVGLASGAYGTHRVYARRASRTLVVERRARRPGQGVRRAPALAKPDRVYPLIRARDVARWRCTPSAYLVVACQGASAQRSRPFAERRGAPGPRWEIMRGGRAGSRRSGQQAHARRPFGAGRRPPGGLYAAPYVVWRRMGTALAAAVVAPTTRHALPNDELAVVPCRSAAEAYFLAGALNSAVARVIVAAALVEPAASIPVLRWVRVPRFVAGNAHHQALAALSRRAHTLARKGDARRTALQEVEAELDQHAAAMWGIAPGQLAAIRAMLVEWG